MKIWVLVLPVAAILATAALACRGQAPAPHPERASDTPSDLRQAEGGKGARQGDSRSKVENLVRLVKQAIDDRRTPIQVAHQARATLTATKNPDWWDLSFEDWDLKLVVGSGPESMAIREAIFSFPTSAGLYLRDLENLFGPTRVIHESKTSSVRFIRIVPSDVSVYARLLASRVSPDALVTGITIRRTIIASGGGARETHQ